MLMRQSTYIFGGAVTSLLVASVTFIGEHDDGAFSSFAQKDLRSEQDQEPCPIKGGVKKEIMRLAKIEMPALQRPKRKRLLNRVRCLRLASTMRVTRGSRISRRRSIEGVR